MRSSTRRCVVRDRSVEPVRLEGPLLEEMIRAYGQGEGFASIAKRHKVWPPRLRQAFVKAGIPITLNRTPPEKENAIARDYVMGGLSIAHITDKHGVTDKVVNRLIKERQLAREVPVVHRPRANKGPFYERWVVRYGKEEADKRREANSRRCSKHSTGSSNPMYGKPAPQGSGNGWKGWYKGAFFRSLRELSFIMELESEGVHWENGERGIYEVRYVGANGEERTYRPDYVVPGVAMYEVKPRRLWDSPAVVAKRQAAEKRCEQLGIAYRLVDPAIDGDKLLAAWAVGDIVWQGKTEEKVKAYYGQKVA